MVQGERRWWTESPKGGAETGERAPPRGRRKRRQKSRRVGRHHPPRNRELYTPQVLILSRNELNFSGSVPLLPRFCAALSFWWKGESIIVLMPTVQVGKVNSFT